MAALGCSARSYNVTMNCFHNLLSFQLAPLHQGLRHRSRRRQWGGRWRRVHTPGLSRCRCTTCLPRRCCQCIPGISRRGTPGLHLPNTGRPCPRPRCLHARCRSRCARRRRRRPDPRGPTSRPSRAKNPTVSLRGAFAKGTGRKRKWKHCAGRPEAAAASRAARQVRLPPPPSRHLLPFPLTQVRAPELMAVLEKPSAACTPPLSPPPSPPLSRA